MHESDTYLMFLEEGEKMALRRHIRIVGEHKFGSADKSVKDQLENITDLERLDRIFHRGLKAAS